MEVKILKEIDHSLKERLDEFVLYHPNSNFFQTSYAFELFNSVKNYESILILANEGKDIVGALLSVLIKESGPAGFFSRRCIVWGGPVVKDNNPEICTQLLKSLNKTVKQKVIYTEFRNLFDMKSFHDSFSEPGFKFKEHLNYVVKLDAEKSVRKRMSSSKWRQIKKSLSEGAQIIIPDTIDQVKSFYEILLNLYRNKVKKPLPPWEFFETFYTMQDLGKYFLIEYQGKIIGGIMCPIYKDRIYEMYIGGLDKEYTQVYPSVLATWAPIQYGLQHGLSYFDFMGAGKPDDDYGVRQFKEKFGGEQVNYGRYLHINNFLMYHLGKIGLTIRQKIF